MIVILDMDDIIHIKSLFLSSPYQLIPIIADTCARCQWLPRSFVAYEAVERGACAPGGIAALTFVDKKKCYLCVAAPFIL
jgi:hypothetical protein